MLETGGTINGILSPDAPPPAHSRVATWLGAHAVELGIEPDVSLLFMKDSRSITDSDRDLLCDAVEACREQAILIPHGTYTMAETGRFLQSRLPPHSGDRTIVLVGALRPLGDADSDAPAALRCAVEALLAGTTGVWVTVGEGLWSPSEVDKDPVSGRFRPRSG